MRCFIAVNFPKEIILEIERAQKLLDNGLWSGKFTKLENLHLTLKFLGEISLDEIEEIKKRLKEIKLKSFKGEIGGLGVFDFRIIWAGILGEGIFGLQKEVDMVLEDLFEKEKRFMSHLTRVKNVRDKKLFLKELKKIPVDRKTFLAENFSLVRSKINPMGVEYKILEKYNLSA